MMADNPNPDFEEAVEAPKKKKGVKRRAFLIGGAALVGAGAFGAWWGDSSARKAAIAGTTKAGEGSFLAWVKIAADDVVTLYSPHIDFGQGSHTGLAQMLAEELDADWLKIKVEQAPAEGGFANAALGRYFLRDMTGMPGLINSVPNALISMIARNMPVQITGGIPQNWGGSAACADCGSGSKALGPGIRIDYCGRKRHSCQIGQDIALWRAGGRRGGPFARCRCALKSLQGL
jgi:isoquinoline 1-oxidoreductase subunit beta